MLAQCVKEAANVLLALDERIETGQWAATAEANDFENFSKSGFCNAVNDVLGPEHANRWIDPHQLSHWMDVAYHFDSLSPEEQGRASFDQISRCIKYMNLTNCTLRQALKADREHKGKTTVLKAALYRAKTTVTGISGMRRVIKHPDHVKPNEAIELHRLAGVVKEKFKDKAEAAKAKTYAS